MTEAITVSLQELRDIIEQLLDHVAANHGETLEIGYDMFWSVPSDQQFDVYSPPPELSIGQLSDSLDNLRGLSAGDRPIGYGLVWVADVLSAIGITEVS